MEFRCRLATPEGEIVEGTYVAESEAHLRHDFEHKGLCVLSMQSRRTLGGLTFGPARRTSVAAPDSTPIR